MLVNIIDIAKKVIAMEAAAIADLEFLINHHFEKAISYIQDCTGRVVISGIGKSSIIAQKIVATLNSTGTPSIFMHAADALHGDLGIVQEGDIVIIISKSGNSPEIKALIPLVKNFGNKLIAISGNNQSFLALQADVLLDTTVSQEACPNNLAPTTSTTAQMVMGDAMAVALMELKGFKNEDFAKFHPGGTLGKKLYLRVADVFIQNEKPSVTTHQTIKEVIVEITNKRLGVTAVVNDTNKLVGIITDGDLRRMLEKNTDIETILAKDIEEYGVLKLTNAGTSFVKKPKSFTIVLNNKFEEAIGDDEEGGDNGGEGAASDDRLFEQLMELRQKQAKKVGLVPWVIFLENSLLDMATLYPTTLQELEKCQGISSAKARRYGKPFIELIAQYVEENNIEKPDDFVMKSVVNKSGNKVYIIQQTDKKISLETIAKNKGWKIAELLEEMETIAASGTKLNLGYAIDEMLDEEDQEEILDYFKTCESSSLDLAQQELSDFDFNWEQLKIMRIRFLSEFGM